MKIHKFYKKAHDKDDTNEIGLLKKTFAEFKGDKVTTLPEDDIEMMKQELPVEILIK